MKKNTHVQESNIPSFSYVLPVTVSNREQPKWELVSCQKGFPTGQRLPDSAKSLLARSPTRGDRQQKLQ